MANPDTRQSAIDRYVSAATDDNTRRAYQQGIAHFEQQCGGFATCA